jgi:hypothetical protein
MRSPLKGPAGNAEFLAWLGHGDPLPPAVEIGDAIEMVLPAQ